MTLMSITQALAKKRIAVVGLGVSGLATVRFLLRHGVKPVVMDSRSKPAGLEQIAADKVDGIYLGELDANRLAKMDMIILSPGLAPTHPAIRFAVAQGAELIGDVELFARVNTKPVLAITGSNGKSTVTMLVEAMLKRSGVKAVAAGNIGLPVLDALQQEDTGVYVLELSSFQLDTTPSLRSVASTILNVSADHLDRYQTMAAYTVSKQQVYRHTQLAVYNLDDVATIPEQADKVLGISTADVNYGVAMHQGQRWLVVDSKPLMPVADMTLFGAHNEFNALVAASLALAAGANRDGIVQALKQFESLPHRCILVADKNGVRWVNDSKATNVNSAWFALESMEKPVVLILGGVDKGNDYELIKDMVAEKVKAIVCLGLDNRKIHEAFGDSVSLIVNTTSAEDAVRAAYHFAEKGDSVLLSPACASFDLFKNYEDRGDQFKKAVREL